jgi:stage II sporulation protein D
MAPDGREAESGAGPWTVTAGRSGIEVKAMDGHTFEPMPGDWRLQTDYPDTTLAIAAAGRPHRYRGSLILHVEASRLTVVNEISIESYLRGVVPCEIGADAPLEAMKAQAVAARTYAFRSRGKWNNLGYDLRDNTDSQSYGGADSERPRSDEAVRDTQNVVLTVDGAPIWAVYSADCGGVSAPGATPDECPRSYVDEESHLHGGPAHNHTWVLRLTPERLAAKLAANRAACGPGQLAGIQILEADVSGRVRKLRLTWQRSAPSVPHSTGSDQTGSEADPATPSSGAGQDPAGGSGPNGQDPTTNPVEPATQSPGADRLPAATAVTRDIAGNTLRTLMGVDTLLSTLFTVKHNPDGTFEFDGRGWGHGRGMCQRGAIAMAAVEGVDFKTILTRYYGGATLSTVVYREAEEEAGEAPPPHEGTDTANANAGPGRP